MYTTFHCTQCNKTLRVPSSAMGKAVRCPNCQSVVKVPQIIQATPVVAQPVASRPVSLPDPFANIPNLPHPSQYGGYNAVPPASLAPKPRPRPRSKRAHVNSGGDGLKALLIALGCFAALIVLGGLLIVLSGLVGTRMQTAASLSPSSIEVPVFPELGAPFAELPGGQKAYFVSMQSHSGPGGSMQFRVYLPAGTPSMASIPCVLVAPAGTNLLHGAALDSSDYHDEALPYAQAGMAVICYSLDGDFPESEENNEARYMVGLQRAFGKFMKAKAGVINGRNALEFALKKLPQVDPSRIYCAGHSSAATLSLLLAAHEPRIAACVAYAPITDLKSRLGELAQDRATRRLLLGITAYLESGSPITYVDDFRSPLFIFHAVDDSNEPFESTAAFIAKMEGKQAKVKFSTVSTGDHYQSMIDHGIPTAIRWLQSLP